MPGEAGLLDGAEAPVVRRAAAKALLGDRVAPMRLKAWMEQGAFTHQVRDGEARWPGPPLWLPPGGHRTVSPCEMAIVWACLCAIMRWREWATTA